MPCIMDMKNYLTAARAAEMLGYAKSSKSSNLGAKAKAGRIPGAIKLGRDWLLPLSWVEQKLAETAEREKDGKPKLGRPKKDIIP